VRFVESAYHAHLNPRIALGLHLHQATHLESGLKQHQSAATVSHSLVNGHSHSGIGAHEHGLHTHEHFHEQDPAWLSFVLNSDEILDADVVRSACETIAKAEPVLRLKGFVRDKSSKGDCLIQGVRDKILCVTQEHSAEAETRSQIVFIGYHLVREKVKDALTSMTGASWY
jgi:cobalamin biosynthesis protein CobW